MIGFFYRIYYIANIKIQVLINTGGFILSLEAEERKKKIIELLNSQGKVKSAELEKKLDVSGETVRRYLTQLEEEGQLKRVYGGAIKISFNKVEPNHLQREVMNLEEKQKIGKAAAELVEDNDIIALDEGTTVFQMLEFIVEKDNLKILTGDFPIASALMDYKSKGVFNGEIIFIGGEISAKHKRTGGSIAEKMMDFFHVEKAFIATTGVLADYGLSVFDCDQGILSRKYIEKAKESIVLADHSKVGVKNYFKFSNIEDVDIIVCDQEMPEDWKSEFESKNTNWITAE